MIEKFLQKLIKNIKNGYIIICDYGYKKKEYYHPQRKNGTIICYNKHRIEKNLFEEYGNKDITSHVNFSRINKISKKNKCKIIKYISLAKYIYLCIKNNNKIKNTKYTKKQINEINTLTSPYFMGEIFKIMTIKK